MTIIEKNIILKALRHYKIDIEEKVKATKAAWNLYDESSNYNHHVWHNYQDKYYRLNDEYQELRSVITQIEKIKATKYSFSKEWCESAARLEGDSEIGAGVLAQDPVIITEQNDEETH